MILQKIKSILQSKNNSIDKMIKKADTNIFQLTKQEKELEKQIVILMINKDRLEDKIKSIFKEYDNKEKINDVNKLIIEEYYTQVQEQERNIEELKKVMDRIHLKTEELIKNKTILMAKKESLEILKKDVNYANLSSNLDEQINEIDCYIAAEKEVKKISVNNNISNISFEKIKEKYKSDTISNVSSSVCTNSRGLGRDCRNLKAHEN